MCKCGRDHQPRERSVKCTLCGRLTLSIHAVCEEAHPAHYLPGAGLSADCPIRLSGRPAPPPPPPYVEVALKPWVV